MIIGAGIVLTLLWYALKGVARFSAPAARAVDLISPWTRRLHAWVLSAPATFTYVAIFSASTFIQKTAPPTLVDLLVTSQSTNLVRLRTRPVSALIDSALWVSDQGAGLTGYILVFAIVVAVAERRFGTPRAILIGVGGHVCGSLLTAWVSAYAINAGLAPRSLMTTTDVGVSYVMVAGCGAAILVLSGWRQAVLAAGLVAAVVVPIFISRTIWDLGHAFAMVCGMAIAAVLLLVAPPRVPDRVPLQN